MPDDRPTFDILASLVSRLTYKEGWAFRFDPDYERGQGSRGPTVVITVDVPNSYAPDQRFIVRHYMIVPNASYNARSWQRWLFEQVLLVERHETMEFFKIDASRPYAPNHGPGNDPYFVFEIGTIADAQQTSSGQIRPDVKV